MSKGRPTVFSKEVCDKILEALKKGYSEKSASGYAGIGYRTYKRWKAEAKDHKTNTPKKCFFEEVESAKSKGEYELDNPIIEDIVENKNVKTALKYKELKLKAQAMRDAKEAQDKLVNAQEIEITNDEVEWINNVSDYNSGTDADTS